MTEQDRQAWIKAWLLKNGSANTLDSAFVDAYIDHTKAPFIVTMIGAFKCQKLSADLRSMFNAGVIERYACGLPRGDAAMGFPRWTYIYSLETL